MKLRNVGQMIFDTVLPPKFLAWVSMGYRLPISGASSELN